jgi:hypothetical protein
VKALGFRSGVRGRGSGPGPVGADGDALGRGAMLPFGGKRGLTGWRRRVLSFERCDLLLSQAT